MSYRKRSEVLEDEIEATRRRIEERLGQLNQNAGPVGLINSALGTEAGSVPETLSAMADRAKANPVSALLIGVGIAGLLMTDNRPVQAGQNRSAVDDRHDEQSPAERVAQNAAALKADVHGIKNRFTGGAEDAASAARQTVGDVAERGREGMASLAGTLAGASDAMSEAARAAPRELRSRGNQFVEWIQENPVSAGLMALAAGAGFASLFVSRNASPAADRLKAAHRLHEMARGEELPTDRENGAKTEPVVNASAAGGEMSKTASTTDSEKVRHLKTATRSEAR